MICVDFPLLLVNLRLSFCTHFARNIRCNGIKKHFDLVIYLRWIVRGDDKPIADKSHLNDYAWKSTIFTIKTDSQQSDNSRSTLYFHRHSIHSHGWNGICGDVFLKFYHIMIGFNNSYVPLCHPYYQRTLQKKKMNQPAALYLEKYFIHEIFQVCFPLICIISGGVWCSFFYLFILRTIGCILSSWSICADNASNSVSDLTGILLNYHCLAPCTSDFSVVASTVMQRLKYRKQGIGWAGNLSRFYFTVSFHWNDEGKIMIELIEVYRNHYRIVIYSIESWWLYRLIIFFFGYRHLISEHLWIKIVHRKSLGHYLLNRIQFYLFTGVRFYLPVSLAFTISSSWIYRFGIDNQVRFAWSMATNIIMIFFFVWFRENKTKQNLHEESKESIDTFSRIVSVSMRGHCEWSSMIYMFYVSSLFYFRFVYLFHGSRHISNSESQWTRNW